MLGSGALMRMPSVAVLTMALCACGSSPIPRGPEAQAILDGYNGVWIKNPFESESLAVGMSRARLPASGLVSADPSKGRDAGPLVAVSDTLVVDLSPEEVTLVWAGPAAIEIHADVEEAVQQTDAGEVRTRLSWHGRSFRVHRQLNDVTVDDDYLLATTGSRLTVERSVYVSGGYTTTFVEVYDRPRPPRDRSSGR